MASQDAEHANRDQNDIRIEIGGTAQSGLGSKCSPQGDAAGMSEQTTQGQMTQGQATPVQVTSVQVEAVAQSQGTDQVTGTPSGEPPKTPQPKVSISAIEPIWRYKRDIVIRRKEQIDNLLVFTALLSAALTPFNIDSYKALHPPAPDPTSQLVLQIALHTGYISSTSADLHSLTVSTATATPSSVAINVLWFSALVLTLSTASIGIVVRQWLDHHDDEPVDVDARGSVQIWHTRRLGYRKWHVDDILSILPVLLHLTLVSFLAGLVIMLLSLNYIVAGFVIVLAGLLWAFLIYTSIISALEKSCPYKSPQALLLLFQSIRRLFRVATHYMQHAMFENNSGHKHQDSPPPDISPYESWIDYEKKHAHPESIMQSVAQVDATLMDDEFLEVFVWPVLKSSDTAQDALGVLKAILGHRADYVLTNPPRFMWLPRNENNSQSINTLGRIAVDVIDARSNTLDESQEGDVAAMLVVTQALDNILDAMPPSVEGTYRQLLNAVKNEKIPTQVLHELVSIIWRYDATFASSMSGKDILAFLNCLNELADHRLSLLRAHGSILSLLVDLTDAKVPNVIAEMVLYSEYRETIQSLSTTSQSLDDDEIRAAQWMFSKAAELVKTHPSAALLFKSGLLNALKTLRERCHDDVAAYYISPHLLTIRGALGDLSPDEDEETDNGDEEIDNPRQDVQHDNHSEDLHEGSQEAPRDDDDQSSTSGTGSDIQQENAETEGQFTGTPH